MEPSLVAFEQERTNLKCHFDCIQGQVVLHTDSGWITLPEMRGQRVNQGKVRWFIGIMK